MATKSSYQIQATRLEELLLSVNRALSDIANRLDKLEGFRCGLETASDSTFSGDITVDGDVSVNDPDGNKLHSMS